MSARLEAAVAELVEALRAEIQPVADAPDRLLSIAEATEILGLGRTALFAELSSGRLASLHVGRRRLVTSSAIAAYIAERQAER